MQNRRVLLTKRLIKESLIEMLLVEKITTISVSRLCDLAQINRSTFYAHYTNIYSVLDELEEEFLKHVSFYRIGESSQKHLKKSIEYLNYIEKNKEVFQTLYTNGYLLPAVIEESTKLYIHECKINNRPIDINKHMHFVQYATYGTFQMISYWLDHKTIYTSEEIAKWILNLAKGIHSCEHSSKN